MSQPGEIVRRIYEDEALIHHPERLIELTAPEVEYVNPPEAVEPGVRRGRTEFADAVGKSAATFETTRYELRELHARDAVVVAAVTFYARPRGSGTEIAQDEAHTWTFRDGRLARFEWGRDLGAALAVAGIGAPPSARE